MELLGANFLYNGGRWGGAGPMLCEACCISPFISIYLYVYLSRVRHWKVLTIDVTDPLAENLYLSIYLG